LGWQSEGRYLPLEDDLASVAYWYQLEPHNPFPPLPAKDALVIVSELPLEGFLKSNVFIDKAQVQIKAPQGVAEVRYTLDGSEPTIGSAPYSAPFDVTQSCTVKARGFKDGKSATPILEGQFVQKSARGAVKVSRTKPGVAYDYFALEDALESTQALAGRKPNDKGVADTIALPARDLPDRFGLVFTGYLTAPARGIYTLSTVSNDGSRLFIGDELVVDNDGPHAAREVSGQIALEPGAHPIRVEYFQAGNDKALEVFIEGPGMAKETVEAKFLGH
ncbi:MAG: hypothetical protein FJY92_03405, partial [Candidatus Hydrogenedentes bacterium]|nr:hypothetical protein [Candidatus Hydrogenedentota bacterium]